MSIENGNCGSRGCRELIKLPSGGAAATQPCVAWTSCSGMSHSPSSKQKRQNLSIENQEAVFCRIGGILRKRSEKFSTHTHSPWKLTFHPKKSQMVQNYRVCVAPMIFVSSKNIAQRWLSTKNEMSYPRSVPIFIKYNTISWSYFWAEANRFIYRGENFFGMPLSK